MTRKKVGVGAAALGLAVWVIYPGSDLAIDQDTCKPSGLIETISSRTFPPQFWEGQEEAIAAEIERIKQSQRDQVVFERVLRETMKGVNRDLKALYAEYPELRSQTTKAERLREMADEVEHREMMALLAQIERKRIQQLEGCQEEIAGRGRWQ